MALQLKQNNEVISVLGILNAENATVLKQHLTTFSKELESVILNLDAVTFIASSSAYALEQLYLDFVKNNRIIQIIGSENKHITETMRQTKTSYILSHDRI